MSLNTDPFDYLKKKKQKTLKQSKPNQQKYGTHSGKIRSLLCVKFSHSNALINF